MTRSVTDVLIGPGALYYATSTDNYTVFPSPPEGSIDGSTVPTGFTGEIGYSDTGWSFEVDRTFQDVIVEEEVDPLKILKTAQNLRLVGVLAQASLENIQLALGGGTIQTNTPTGHDTYLPPASTDAPDELALVLAVPAAPVSGNAKVRYLEIPKAIATGAVALQHQKAPQKTQVAVEFRLTVPSSGEIFRIVEQVA